MEKEFKNISELLFSQLNKEEDLILSLSGENSQFIRFKNASVRQTGLVDDAELELKFISAVKLGQELIGNTKIQKKTKTMVFLTTELIAENKIVATASGVWKILRLSGAGPGG